VALRPLTILVGACGAPGTAALLRALRANGERDVRLVGTDMSERAIGRHLCDAFHLVPAGTDPAFVDAVRAVVEREDVDVVLPQSSFDLGGLATVRDSLGVPVLVSGAAAQVFADLLAPLGMPVEVVSGEAGDAAALKLVRSVFMKGLAAAIVESMQAAEAIDRAAWLEREIEALIGRAFLERAREGSRKHAARHVDEMEAACDLLRELGVEPFIATASAARLAELATIEDR
jgi:hypothetical protein